MRKKLEKRLAAKREDEEIYGAASVAARGGSRARLDAGAGAVTTVSVDELLQYIGEEAGSGGGGRRRKRRTRKKEMKVVESGSEEGGETGESDEGVVGGERGGRGANGVRHGQADISGGCCGGDVSFGSEGADGVTIAEREAIDKEVEAFRLSLEGGGGLTDLQRVGA